MSKTICRKVSVSVLAWRNVGWFHQRNKHYILHPKIYILHVGSPTGTASYTFFFPEEVVLYGQKNMYYSAVVMTLLVKLNNSGFFAALRY